MRAYVRRLGAKWYIRDVTPLEVPNVKQPRKYPEYLTKQELSKMLQYLEDNLLSAKM